MFRERQCLAHLRGANDKLFQTGALEKCPRRLSHVPRLLCDSMYYTQHI